MLLRLLAPIAFAALLLLAGCADTPLPPPLEVYEEGRAVVVDTADSGRALLIEHEPFDSVMTEPMVMELPLDDPRQAEGLQQGDKIGFDLVLRQRYQLENVRKLPASTQINLTADTTSADTSATGGAGAAAPDTSGS